jgi:beta-galactosidase
LKEATPWAEAGHEIAHESLPLVIDLHGEVSLFIPPHPKYGRAEGKSHPHEFVWSKEHGTLERWSSGGRELLKAPLRFSAFRAPVDNDRWAVDSWYAHGLHQLEPTVVEATLQPGENGVTDFRSVVEWRATEGAAISGFLKGHIHLQPQPLPAEAAAFRVESHYVADEAGTLEVTVKIHPHGAAGLFLPRIGLEFLLPKEFREVRYYGCGPYENTADRRSGVGVGRYETTVEELFVPYAKPMDCGTRTGVQWVEVRDGDCGLRIEAIEIPFIFSALPHRAMELVNASHIHRLPASTQTVLHLDARHCGVGGNSCGPRPLDRDLVRMEPVTFKFSMSAI